MPETVRRPWRLLLDGPCPGALNMAIDRAVLEGVAAGTSPPTLRVYAWEMPTVTLGRFQPLTHVDLAACADLGFDVVRRPTGGRGVLHDDEVTYSMVASRADGVPRGTAASYEYLSAPLAAAYRTLGVDAALARRSSGDAASGACYLHATRADHAVGAAKLSGSAQVWRSEAVLQHGSFVVSRDVAAEARVFQLDAESAAALEGSTATLTGLLGRTVVAGEIIAAVCDAVRAAWGVELVEGELSEVERALAESLRPEHEVDVSLREVRDPTL